MGEKNEYEEAIYQQQFFTPCLLVFPKTTQTLGITFSVARVVTGAIIHL